jgi:predicted nucleic acid-binding protein
VLPALRDAALSAVGLTKLVHGIYRAPTPEIRSRREAFLNELLADLTVYPYSRETALLAGKLDAEQQCLGNVIPFADLLIGATALALSYSVLTVNVRHFERIPGLSVVNSSKKTGDLGWLAQKEPGSAISNRNHELEWVSRTLAFAASK